MNSIDKYLQLWNERSDGKFIPITSDELNCGIKKINTEEHFTIVKKQLRDEGYIKINLQGTYDLTEKGISEWSNLAHDRIKPFSSNSIGKEWQSFRNLLSYYIECAKLEETPTHVFYGEKENIDYFIPESLPIDWLQDLNTVQEGSELNLTYNIDNEYIINQFKSHYDEDEAVYIGYPIIAYRSKAGNLIYYPIGVIPVNVKLKPSSLEINPLNTITLVPDYFQSKINSKILNLYIPKYKEQAFMKNISNTHHDDEYVGLFDLSRAIKSIEKIFTKDNSQDEKLSPVMPSQVLPINLSVGERILCNSVVIYSERDFKYSKVMIKELTHIRDKVSDSDLDKTSLAYIYRNPKLEKSKNNNKVGIGFIESNYEQLESLEKALNNPCTKITGPPGTGKSQVATNIIANSIYYNESVLFTSNNQKAVAAIRDRTESLFKNHNSNLYLTEFCYDQTKSMNNPWYRKDITTSIANGMTFPVDINNSTKLQRIIDLILYNKELINKEDLALIDYYKALNDYLTSKNILLRSILSENNEITLNKEIIELLKKNANRLKTKKESIFGRFIWNHRDKEIVEKAVTYIKETLPILYKLKLEKLKNDEIKKEIHQIVDNYYKYSKTDTILEKSTRNLTENTVDKSSIKKISEYYKSIDLCKFDGYCNTQNNRLNQYEDNVDLVSSIDSLEGKYRNKDSVKILDINNLQSTNNDIVLFNHFLKIHPSWAVTLLSLKYSSPCLPGIFDRVIIDEAAQCNCISIIPALFRAKNVVVMGDRQQLPPILNISTQRNDYFWNKFDLKGMEKYDYLQATAYSVIPTAETMLKEHFRCDPAIAEIFSNFFYADKLRTRTDKAKLNFPKNCGYKSAVEWIDIKDSFSNEIESAMNHVSKLLSNNYLGTIGIISPLRIVVDTIQERLDVLKISSDQVISKTVASFQGSECDIIIFVVAYNSEILKQKGKHWYLTDKSNSYIYNVAISRAKALLILVGDREACRNSGFKILEKLSNSPKTTRNILVSDEPIFESPWEEKLYFALLKENIITKTQVPLVGRRLDLAYISDEINIDIEVDGVAYHTTSLGTVKMDDIFRDMQVEAAGWFVIRFWVFKLQKNMDKCVNEIKQMIELKGYPDSNNESNISS